MRSLVTTLALGLSLVAIAGCGGGSKKSDGGSGKPLSVAAYKQQANKVCAQSTSESDKIKEPSSPAGLQDYLTKLTNAGKDEGDKLAALKPPASLAAGAKQAVTDLRTVTTALQGLLDKHLPAAQLATAYRSIPAAAVNAIKDFRTSAAQTGLAECAK